MRYLVSRSGWKLVKVKNELLFGICISGRVGVTLGANSSLISCLCCYMRCGLHIIVEYGDNVGAYDFDRVEAKDHGVVDLLQSAGLIVFAKVVLV